MSSPKKSTKSHNQSLTKNTKKIEGEKQMEQMEKWRSDLRKNRNIYTQEITSRNLVTLDELCKYLNVHYDPKSKPASGAFNNTYFTYIKGNTTSEIAIRVSKEPIARYTYHPRNSGQEFLDFESVVVDEENTKKIKIARKYSSSPVIPNYSSLHTKEIEKGEFLIQLERSKTNWLESSHKGLCPPIKYYGYIIKKIPIGGLSSGHTVEIRSCIVSERYSMDLKGFYKDLVTSDKYNEEERESINNKVLVKVQTMIRGLVELYIICADIKPANMVIKYKTKKGGKIDVNSIEVRLIDLDGDWCTTIQNELAYNQATRISARTMKTERKKNIELLMLVILGFHFNKSIKYNPFTAYFQDVFRNKTSSELHTVLREPTTISHEVIDSTTDLSLLPLNETYDHYFLDRDPNDDEVIIPDPAGKIFKELCKRIQSPYEPPSGTSTPTGSMSSRSSSRSRSSSSMSFGGKKQRTLRYKISKRKGGSTKRKTLKIRKI